MSSNWKNVNNWYWVNKNCLNWAQKYFAEQLEGLKTEKDGHTVSIIKLDDCSGDVDLNMRKGKIITIYDVSLKLSFQGELVDGTEVSGSITIPEVAHDSEADDYVFDITINEDSSAKQPIKPVIRKQLQPLICEKLGNFADDMIATHRNDVYIDPSKLNNPAATA
ncbi:activator of Hsp90 ATPase [Zychaea mexicana]|uniref:activator of Hsp90 ATPase n=1 Tax=Zychaea mexicana TaxID=64656 RepID=UPI0022FF0667|nr:activator of Hsp90 ATPase [Zychaea mexicana]KAI9489834.1 activator of Hsp90 ATPase [Zychaea mexicana]